MNISSTSDRLPESIERLIEHIENVPARFQQITQDQLLYKPGPAKWSRQEVLGHLIDSALNNLRRFTEAQFQPQPYKVIAYQQDALVQVNHYQELPLQQLVQLWQSINSQIVFVMQHMPVEKRYYTVLTGREPDLIPQTLEWLFEDYVIHLEHHLKTI